MAIASSALIRRVRLMPGESLASLSERLTKLNHYESLGILHYLYFNGLERDRLDRPSKAATYERIATLTGIDPGELYNATAHRFAQTLTPPDCKMNFIKLMQGQKSPLLSEGIASKLLRSKNAAQYCPDCLKELACHKVAWIPIAVSSCLRHKCLLLAQCPNCEKPISIQSVVEGSCEYCRANLVQAQSLSVEGDEFGLLAQQVIQAWLGLVAMPTCLSLLPNHPPQVLCRVLEGLRWSVLTAGFDWEYVHQVSNHLLDGISGRTKPSPAESYYVYATAFKGLLNWPEGFFDFLQAYRFRDGGKFSSGLQAGLGTLYSRWLEHYWRHPAFRFVQEAFNRYLAERYAQAPGVTRLKRCKDSPALVDRFVYINVSQAARLLGVSAGTINNLADVGRLAVYEPEGISSSRRYRFFRRTDVLDIRLKWLDSVSLAEVSERLGVSETIVVGLVEVGQLEAERGPSVDGNVQWMFTNQSGDECLTQITSGCRACKKPSGELVDLTTAAKKLAVVGLNAAGVLRCVAERKLRGWWPPDSPRDLGALCFKESDIEDCIEVIRVENGWLRREDVAQRVKVKACVASRWIAADLLVSVAICGSARYFDRNEVEHFIADHVFSDEAAEILGVGRLVVQKWARNGRLRPVAGPGVDECHRYLFRREDVERLRPENRLTAPQLAKFLGISRSQMCQWIKQGKVQPVSGPGIDDCGHYLFLAQEVNIG